MLISARPAESRVAVVLNGRARGVSPELVHRIGRMVPRRDLFVSRTLGDSREIAQAIVERGYPAVLFGGGDGTFVQCLADLRERASAEAAPLPSVGVLKLGTGNALARALGASPPTVSGLRHDLDRAAADRRRDLPLLEVDGVLTPFAGAGLDAQILDDFTATTRALDALGVGRRLGPGARYALAVASRSIPRYWATPLVEVVATNLGSPAIRVGAGGRPVGEPVARGGILYRGRCALAAGSTIPWYGLGIRIFPHARARRDRFHLRCACSSTREILAHLPSIWRGEYASDTITDWLVDDVELRFSRPTPVQIGGDLLGARDRLRLTLSGVPVSVFA